MCIYIWNNQPAKSTSSRQTHRCNLPCWCFIYWHLMNSLVSFSITPWSISTASNSNQVALRQEVDTTALRQSNMKCFKKWDFPTTSLDSQKNPPMTSMVSSMPKATRLWKRPSQRALVRPVPCQVPGQPRSWKTWQLGWFRGKFCWKTLFLHGFTMVFYLSKWLNIWVSWKKMPKNRYAQGNTNQTGDIPLLYIAMLDYRRVGYIEWRCPAAMVSHRGKTCHINITRARGLSLIISKWEQIQSTSPLQTRNGAGISAS